MYKKQEYKMKDKLFVEDKGRNEKLDIGMTVGMSILCIFGKQSGKFKRFNYFVIVRTRNFINKFGSIRIRDFSTISITRESSTL